MNATTHKTHRLFRSWASVVAAAALLGSGTVFATSGPALATLPGSSFNGADGSVTSDLTAGAVDITDPVAGADTTNYSGGATDDDICPTVATGTAPNASDIDHFYFGSQNNASGVFLYLGWHRFTTTGTTTLDFELNKSLANAPACGSHQPARTAGDLLITYDFTGGGGTVTLSSRSWVGTASAGAWSAPTTLTTNAEASVNAAGDFGEMVINATASGLMPTGVCTSLAGAFAKSRASVTFNSQIKDFTTRVSATVSNCGSVVINKNDDAIPANPLDGAVFKLFTDVANAPGVAVTGMTCTTVAGTCTISNVIPGTYWIVEDTVPTGHSGPAAPQKVVVALAGNTPAGPYAFVNPRQAASVAVTKVDDLGAAVDGAVLTLFTDNAGAPGTAVPGMFCATVAGVCTISNVLPPGDYWVVETVTPAGYSTATSMPVTVTLGGTVPVTLVDNRQPATIFILKKNDAGSALAGATFGLFNDNAGVIGTAVTGKTCTSSAAGTCSITGILPAGTYWVRETTTPAGHNTAADQKVTVALGQTVTVNFVNVRQPVSISLAKRVNGVHPSATSPLLVGAGSTLNYALTITNTGSLSLTIDQLNDTLKANVASTCTQGIGSTLAPAASFTCAYTSTANQPETNIATVAAVDQLGRFVTADDTTSVKPVNAQVSLTKTGPDNAHVGDTIEYVLTVVNTGDHPLTDVTVSDPACATAPVLKTKTGGDQDDVLEPGEVWTYTCNHVVTAADGTSLTNTATVAALDPLLRSVTSDGKHTLTILHPGVKITKTANPASVSVSDTVTFTYVVTNTGDTPLHNVIVTDDVLGAIGVVTLLAPGASHTFTKPMTVNASSPTTNVGKAVGTDTLGTQVSDSASLTIAIVLGVVLQRPELPKTGTDAFGLATLGGSLIFFGWVLLYAGRRRPRRSGS